MTIERILIELLEEATNTRHGCLKYWEPGQDSYTLVWTYDWRTWPWPGKPFTERFKERKLPRAFHIVDYQIRQAALTECLTSSIAYVRECKKWLQASNGEQKSSTVRCKQIPQDLYEVSELRDDTVLET